VSYGTFVNNSARGGTGVTGGAAQGGAIYNSGFFPAFGNPTVTLDQCTVSSNAVTGGAGGAGGSGGNAQGGGIFNGGLTASEALDTVTMTHTNVTGNQADGGAAGVGGSDGTGLGGGVYNSPFGTFIVDAFSPILGNKASTGFDDVFGVLTLI
jgi:hypothetical protein